MNMNDTKDTVLCNGSKICIDGFEYRRPSAEETFGPTWVKDSYKEGLPVPDFMTKKLQLKTEEKALRDASKIWLDGFEEELKKDDDWMKKNPQLKLRDPKELIVSSTYNISFDLSSDEDMSVMTVASWNGTKLKIVNVVTGTEAETLYKKILSVGGVIL